MIGLFVPWCHDYCQSDSLKSGMHITKKPPRRYLIWILRNPMLQGFFGGYNFKLMIIAFNTDVAMQRVYR